MKQPYRMTDRQRALLARVAFGDEMTDRDAYRLPDALLEAYETLRTNGYVETYRGDKRFMVRATEEGMAVAEANQHVAKRSRVETCPCCVVARCVCSVKIICLTSGPHSVGCHGTHD